MKKLFLICIAVLVASGLIFVGCASPSSPAAVSPPTSSSAAPQTTAPAVASTTSPPTSMTTAPASTSQGVSQIIIGSVAPETGDFANLGLGSAFGLKEAVDDINAQGGIMVADLGKKLPVKLVVVDDQSSPTNAGNLASDLVLTSKAIALLGETEPVEYAALAPVIEKYKVPSVLDAGPLEPWNAMRSASTPPWKYAWGMGFAIATPAPAGDFRAGVTGYTLMDLENAILKQVGDQTNKKVALFASDDPDGRGWYSAAVPALKQAGLTVLGTDKELGIAPDNTTDFTSVIKAWMNDDAQMLWGCAPAAWFGTLWRQSAELGFHPKMVWAAKAGLYYPDIKAWGDDLPNGVCCELWWTPAYQNVKGIGSTTPQSLANAWTKSTGQQFNQSLGEAYASAQVLFSAIEKAGSLDSDKINAAIAATDMNTICSRVVFNPATHFSVQPVFLIQWQKANNKFGWSEEVVSSPFSFIPKTANFLFPIPSK